MMGSRGSGRRRALRPILTAVATVVAVILGGVVAAPAIAETPAVAASISSVSASTDTAIQPATLVGFNPGSIISDAVFFDTRTMSADGIQSFFASKVPVCTAGYTCLKDKYDTTRKIAADPMCNAYAGGTSERASLIVYKVAVACGINPQVLIVTLQKEQSLVTHTAPTDLRYRKAMGQGCPDTAACDARYYGFFNQVYGAAWQLKRYANPPGTSQYFTWYAPGKTWSILYNPNRACGSKAVTIQNQATADLYYYTPYQPNAAALKAGYGIGDSCSSYGNRNFYNYFTDWFGSTQVPAKPCAQPTQVVAAAGEFTVVPASLNARIAPSTLCDDGRLSLSAGTVVTRVGTWGVWWRVRYDKRLFWVHSDYLTPTPAVAYTTSRLTGASRYDTAVEVSKRTYPTGTQTVFIASGVDFPDALTSGAAAGRVGASLLLTEPTALRQSVADEIVRLAPTKVVLIGGETRVSSAIATQIAALVPRAAIERLTGRDRYETSRLIAAKYFGGATVAYITTGLGFPDAIVAASLGGAQGRPVVLVDGAAATLDDATKTALKGSGITTTIVAGGPDTVSAGIEAGLTAAGITAKRVAGRDRYETARLLVAAAYPSGAANVLIATGENFPDALVGAVMAARTKSPLFTTPSTCLEGATKDWMIGSGVKTETLLGGLPSLNEAVAASVRC